MGWGIWYRHSGQPAVDRIPYPWECTFKTYKDNREILEDIGTHHITHMYVREGDVPSLNLVAPKLTALKIENCPRDQTTSALRSLKSLTELKELYIGWVDLPDGLPHVISQLTSLEKLELEYCALTDLPESLTSLTKLRHLALHGNKFINGLPEVVSKLTSLERLELAYCQLQHLPASMSSLSTLKYLDLHCNDLSQGLPEVITQLTSLETLWLYGCQLTNLPASLCSLVNLKVLWLSGNHFLNGLPEVVVEMTSLEKLRLDNLKLTSLPTSFDKLTKLEKLWLNENHFKSLPPEICELENLSELRLSDNEQLESLHPGILRLSKLEELDVSRCSSLTTPPPNVSKQGLKAIKQYYKDLEEGEGRSLPAATVSVIGKSKAGKTSLIRTLQQNARVLTGSVGTGEDVSTKVFNFEEVEVENTKLRFIDFGGQEIYHLAYGLTLRENCVPVIVANMEMYKEMSEEIGDREAVRRLYFDWMAHLYLSQPDLPAPKLVITHKDKFASEEFEEVKSRFLANSTSARDSILSEESRLKSSEFHKIKHLSEGTQMFHEDNIFEVGSADDQVTFQSLKQQLLDHCKAYVMKVARIWEEVEQSIQAVPTGFSRFDDLLPQLAETHEVEKEQLEIILTYMHYCGKLLWYKDVKGLSSYIFHKISAVTKLFNVLLDHDDARKWEERLQKFENRKILSHNFQKESYLQSAEKFKSTGIVSSMLLAYLIRSETEFNSDEKLEIALKLLTTFRLTFGEVKSDGKPACIVPHFAVGYSPSTPMTTSDIQLHVDLVFYGLPLPQYVYHEMTVELLKLFLDEMDAPSVKHNGAVVEVDESTVCLTHDVKAGTASVSISSPPEDIDESWNHLIKIVNNIIQHVQRTWKAATLECVLHCAHCKLIGGNHPSKMVNPSWSVLSTAAPAAEAKKRRMVDCGGERIPSALKFPCKSFSEDDKQRLQEYVESVKSTKPRPKKCLRPVVTHVVDPPESDTSHPEVSFFEVGDKLNNSSFRVTPTEDEVIKDLFRNTDKVYNMTSPRGMALVINNADFSSDSQLEGRAGSVADLRNMERMLKDMGFEVQAKLNQTAREMLTTIQSTTTQHSKLVDHGMFVLVLMSHGGENDLIFGTDGKVIDLHDVFGLLSSQNFPAMTKKPKLVIVQACGGVLGDFGSKGNRTAVKYTSPGMPTRPKTGAGSQGFGAPVQPHLGTEIDHLNTDYLIVIKASFNTYASMRHDQHGCPFISYLVYNFSKYACNRDVETLCKMIQHDVRVASLQLAKDFPTDKCFGQAPFFFSMLTGLRKLYLFPDYDGE